MFAIQQVPSMPSFQGILGVPRPLYHELSTGSVSPVTSISISMTTCLHLFATTELTFHKWLGSAEALPRLPPTACGIIWIGCTVRLHPLKSYDFNSIGQNHPQAPTALNRSTHSTTATCMAYSYSCALQWNPVHLKHRPDATSFARASVITSLPTWPQRSLPPCPHTLLLTPFQMGQVGAVWPIAHSKTEAAPPRSRYTRLWL